MSRQHSQHVAVRFGDAMRVRVYLDGEDVTLRVNEAWGGDPGWVVFVNHDAVHPGGIRTTRIGTVVVEWV